MKFRLETIDPELMEKLGQADPGRLRQLAANVVEETMRRVQLDDGDVSEALKQLQCGQYGDSAERSSLERRVEALDERQWATQEAVEDGTLPESDYAEAFARARAAHALWFALDADPLYALAEATYEADAALDGSVLPWLEEELRVNDSRPASDES